MKQKKIIPPWNTPGFRRKWPLGLYFSIMASSSERARQMKIYRSKFGDLIEFGSPVADGICTMLVEAAKHNESNSVAALVALANRSTAALAELMNSELKNPALAPKMLLELLRVLYARIDELTRFAESNKELARIIAQNSNAWPAVIHKQAKHRLATERFILDELQLGQRFYKRITGKTASSLEHRVAERLLDQILAYRNYRGPLSDKIRRLPAFCRTSLPEWKPIARKMIYEIYGRKLIQHPQFENWKKGKTQFNDATPGDVQTAIIKEVLRRFSELAPAELGADSV